MSSLRSRLRPAPLVLALLALASLAVTACGDDTTTVERTVTATETEAETTTQPSAEGLTGPLGTSSVGPVELGMTREEVRELFGDPDRVEDYVNEPAGKSEADAIWRWGPAGAGVRLRFDPGGGFVSYSSNDPALATETGIHAGSSRQELIDAYGDQLQDDSLGNPVIWEGEPNDSPEIVFGLDGNRVAVIHGGNVEYAE